MSGWSATAIETSLGVEAWAADWVAIAAPVMMTEAVATPTRLRIERFMADLLIAEGPWFNASRDSTNRLQSTYPHMAPGRIVVGGQISMAMKVYGDASAEDTRTALEQFGGNWPPDSWPRGRGARPTTSSHDEWRLPY
ncbi:hypothetical protein [Nonomuraea sp. NPDC049141]|uniref:hypothetical protein n=1 Tax=Nonomuraea sp. NPDC049141 TaxID=3155500 RepID=UPI00340DC678